MLTIWCGKDDAAEGPADGARGVVTDLVEVDRAGTPAEAEQRALVLSAMGIYSRVVAADDGVSLLVHAADAPAARRELAAFDRESVTRPSSARPVRPFGQGVDAALGSCAILMFLFAAERRDAFSTDWLTVGAAQAGLIQGGAWWRTLTALGLHADLGHLLGNLAFGAVVVLLASQLLGTGLAWLAILAAGGLGNALNAVLQPTDHTAIGASTAVFGALGILSGHARRSRVVAWRGGLRRWAPVAAGIMLLVFLGTEGERTDVGAHVAGFAVGGVIGLILAHCAHQLPQGCGAQRLYGLLACGLFALAWLLALATAR